MPLRFERLPNCFPHTHRGKVGKRAESGGGHPSFLFLIWAVVGEMQLAIVYTKGQAGMNEAKSNASFDFRQGVATDLSLRTAILHRIIAPISASYYLHF